MRNTSNSNQNKFYVKDYQKTMNQDKKFTTSLSNQKFKNKVQQSNAIFMLNSDDEEQLQQYLHKNQQINTSLPNRINNDIKNKQPEMIINSTVYTSKLNCNKIQIKQSEYKFDQDQEIQELNSNEDNKQMIKKQNNCIELFLQNTVNENKNQQQKQVNFIGDYIIEQPRYATPLQIQQDQSIGISGDKVTSIPIDDQFNLESQTQIKQNNIVQKSYHSKNLVSVALLSENKAQQYKQINFDQISGSRSLTMKAGGESLPFLQKQQVLSFSAQKQKKQQQFSDDNVSKIIQMKIQTIRNINNSFNVTLKYRIGQKKQNQIQITLPLMKFIEQYYLVQFKIYIPSFNPSQYLEFWKWRNYIDRLFNYLRQNYQHQLIQFLDQGIILMRTLQKVDNITKSQQKEIQILSTWNMLEKIDITRWKMAWSYCHQQVLKISDKILNRTNQNNVRNLIKLIESKMLASRKILKSRKGIEETLKIKIFQNIIQNSEEVNNDELDPHLYLLNLLYWILGFDEVIENMMRRIQEIGIWQKKEHKKNVQLPSLRMKHKKLKKMSEQQKQRIKPQIQQGIQQLYSIKKKINKGQI